MSYAIVDHAGWAENNVRLGRKRFLKARRRKPRKDTDKGYGAAPETLTPLQRKVFDILGMVGGGIYNAPIAWDAIVWRWGGGIAIPWRGSMSTFDFRELSMLVLLCHEARIRCEVRPHGFHHLLLTFFQRGHDGSMAVRHPNIEEAVVDFRQYLPVDHPVIYREFSAQQGKGEAA